jgi:hypothetical protein
LRPLGRNRWRVAHLGLSDIQAAHRGPQKEILERNSCLFVRRDLNVAVSSHPSPHIQGRPQMQCSRPPVPFVSVRPPSMPYMLPSVYIYNHHNTQINVTCILVHTAGLLLHVAENRLPHQLQLDVPLAAALQAIPLLQSAVPAGRRADHSVAFSRDVTCRKAPEIHPARQQQQLT